ncbi:hypothetical protein Fcan01_09305 [Folsomia candida]|uniref:Uncharacterized protein n=1 Tax=Folsomia candida TaxID=158441 RepID=A0A226EER8_FOLCA|nr:hypothetical protein Fcan01_09305 [Folsomia candida]
MMTNLPQSNSKCHPTYTNHSISKNLQSSTHTHAHDLSSTTFKQVSNGDCHPGWGRINRVSRRGARFRSITWILHHRAKPHSPRADPLTSAASTAAHFSTVSPSSSTPSCQSQLPPRSTSPSF